VAKASAQTGSTTDQIHTRTTAGAEESQVAVIGQDGTDNVAALVQRGSLPASTDYGVLVMPMATDRPSYQVVTAEITAGTSTGITRPLQLWHPATLAKDVFVFEIGANIGVPQTAGRFAFELEFVTAESATGSLITANVQQGNRGDPATGMTIRQSVTAETAAAAGVFQRAAQAPASSTVQSSVNYDGVVIYRAKDLANYSDALTLRNGVAEGILVRHNILSTLTTAPVYSVYARWIERA
jgi:hypothetical protein